METRIVTVEVAGATIASVYVPNGGKDFAAKLRFLEALARWAADAAAAGRTLVVAATSTSRGPTSTSTRRSGSRAPSGSAPTSGRSSRRRSGTASSTSVAPPIRTNDGLFTYWAPWRNLRQRNIGWRIDYVLASAPLAARARRCAVLADFGTSDHAPGRRRVRLRRRRPARRRPHRHLQRVRRRVAAPVDLGLFGPARARLLPFASPPGIPRGCRLHPAARSPARLTAEVPCPPPQPSRCRSSSGPSRGTTSARSCGGSRTATTCRCSSSRPAASPAARSRGSPPAAAGTTTTGARRRTSCSPTTTRPASPRRSWSRRRAASSPARRTSRSRSPRSSSPGWTAAPRPARSPASSASRRSTRRGRRSRRTTT